MAGKAMFEMMLMNERVDVDEMKTGEIKDDQRYVNQAFSELFCFQFLFRPQEELIKSEDFQSKGHESQVTENRHMENPPKIKIRQRIFPSGIGEKIPQLPEDACR
jgi:hypothetical protein